GLDGRTARLARHLRRDHEVLRQDRRSGPDAPRPEVLRRGAAPVGDPHPHLDARHLGPGVHHRPAVRHRGRVLQPRGRRPGVRRRVRRVVRPARARAVRVRLHDVRQGRHRHRGRARLHADLGRDRRARGHGHRLRALPVRDPSDRRLARAAVHVHRRRRRRVLRELPGGGRADRRGVVRRVLPHLLDVPEPTRPALQRHQGHGDGDVHRARRLLLRLPRWWRPGGSRHRDGEVHGVEHRARASHRDARHPALLGREPPSPNRRM
ncbi:MAG: hypothetical protein AVDCRST_MAG85-3872, partial [uncultured Solirubrobacteraceae bacterium]